MVGSSYRDTSDPNESVITHWIMVGLAVIAAGYLGWLLGWPWIFDIEDPEFNPLILIEVFLIGVGAWNGWLALRWMLRQRRFGATEMHIDGPVPVRLGRPLTGRLQSARPLAPEGDYRITLTCHEIHEMRDTRDSSNSPYRNEEFVVWTKELTLPATTDAVAGLPFRFDLPASVGQKPVRPMEQPNKYFEFKASINVPGFRKIMTHNAPPVGRRWQIKVMAPMPGTDFRADFVVPVLDE